ncbi:hypothetical protein PsorP6_004800 [Peronosclerospora sorghi]|uniref:Uncharacterized protein n=1 Tax=Peronosclerospora sorghi TaxID=230839 RepID=A0ACC0VJ64_9STRA|nr:hypothetical protein PsorP6_004800 [Peronosclerospora sorghi]
MAFGYACHSAQAAPEALSEATFDHRTSAGVWFIKFFAPVSHCKKLAPTIDELSEAEGLEDANVHVANVDCSTERSLCERFSVGSYPTLKVVADGKSYDYNGRREVPIMVAFATDGYKREFGDAVLSYAEFLEHRKAAAAEKLENERKSAVVQLTTLSFEEENKLSRTLKENVDTKNIAKVDCTVHRRVCSRFGVNGYPTIFYINDGQVYRYKGGRSLPAFLDFVESGWKAAEPTGNIPEEGFFSKIVDTVIEWCAEHTVLAVLDGVLMISIVVSILVALLDYWLGADDVSQYKKTLNKMEGKKEEDGKEDELPPPTPSAIEAKASGQKPKDE